MLTAEDRQAIKDDIKQIIEPLVVEFRKEHDSHNQDIANINHRLEEHERIDMHFGTRLNDCEKAISGHEIKIKNIEDRSAEVAKNTKFSVEMWVILGAVLLSPIVTKIVDSIAKGVGV